MPNSAENITKDYVVIQELDDFIENGNGDTEKLFARVLKRNMITTVQIKQDLQPLVKCPSLACQFKSNFLKTSAKVGLISFFLFMAFYTFVEVCGYAEALSVFK